MPWLLLLDSCLLGRLVSDLAGCGAGVAALDDSLDHLLLAHLRLLDGDLGDVSGPTLDLAALDAH